MGKYFFDLSGEAQLALIKSSEENSEHIDVIIEKDLWICWLLEKVFSLPEKMAFKGGTSLSKGFGLISRFSEDVDITIDYKNFRDDFDVRNASRSQLKKISNELKMHLKEYVETKILPFLEKEISTLFPESAYDIKCHDNGENLTFYYPSVLSNQPRYLRDHVLLEFGIRNDTEPCEKKVITPYIANVTGEKFDIPQPNIAVLSPVRTFWEKATLIHVECNRERLKRSPERLSRHWYDLYHLSKSWVAQKAFNTPSVLQHVLDHKKAFYHASYANYDKCTEGDFRLIPDAASQLALAADYKQMSETGMFIGEPPVFEELVEHLVNFELSLNNKIANQLYDRS